MFFIVTEIMNRIGREQDKCTPVKLLSGGNQLYTQTQSPTRWHCLLCLDNEATHDLFINVLIKLLFFVWFRFCRLLFLHRSVYLPSAPECHLTKRLRFLLWDNATFSYGIGGGAEHISPPASFCPESLFALEQVRLL